MDSITYHALQASIEKWEQNTILPVDQIRIGPQDCPLCQVFISQGCFGCPIQSATKLSNCQNTPYFEFYAFLKYLQNTGRKRTEALTRAAQEEVNFLRSLVPAGGPDDE